MNVPSEYRPKESFVVTSRVDMTNDRTERWRVWITGREYGLQTRYFVHAERTPDEACIEVATIGIDRERRPREVGLSLGGARKEAREMGRLLACGRGVGCPGITACQSGAPCPFNIAPQRDAEDAPESRPVPLVAKPRKRSARS